MAAKDPVIIFLDYLKFEKRYSPHTIRSYQDDLKQFFDYLQLQFRITALHDISSTFIRSWLASLKDEGITNRTINRKISCLKSFFKYQLRIGELAKTPMYNVISPKIKKRLPEFIKENELEKLLKNIQYSEDWKGLNARLLITLFYCTGMRLAELINLKEKQIDRYKKVIKVLGKGNKERIIPVSGELLELLHEYKQHKKREFEHFSEYVFVTESGKKLYPKYAYLLIRKYLGNIQTLEKKSPHVLRHTFATHLMNNGADLNSVKELLGHSSLAATQVYTHNTIEKLKEVYKKAHPKA